MAEPPDGAERPDLFVFDRVRVDRDGTRILHDVCAQAPSAGITVVAGPSGAGKTTLLRLCNRLEVPSAGSVRYRGHDIAAVNPLWLRRRVGMVFQQPTLFGGTVRDNLAVARPDGEDSHYRRALRQAALDPGMLARAAASLSGGEAQRACLARTLVTEPQVLLLDEPTAALDAAPKRSFERLARQLAAAGMPMLWVTHDLGQLRRVADHVMALVAGAIVYTGKPDGLERVAALESFLSEGDR
ncbi:MAG: ATP-binding cassette domain-containing protein [Nitriliruptorales bacterium]|nr:ATP-binding cassette domain-containing protein [Nitriliruptorales bacterium]